MLVLIYLQTNSLQPSKRSRSSTTRVLSCCRAPKPYIPLTPKSQTLNLSETLAAAPSERKSSKPGGRKWQRTCFA